MQLHVLAGVQHPQISPGASGTPSNKVSSDPTGVPAKWHLNSSDCLSRVHECDRQTDRATEQCVAIGGIVCTRAIPSNDGTEETVHGVVVVALPLQEFTQFI